MLVEESALLRVGTLRRRGQWLASGSLQCTVATLCFRVEHEPEGPEVLLAVEKDGQVTKQTICCESTEVTFGTRWWFLCPHCWRRCGVLHLPRHPGYTELRCRECYKLRYRSQEHDLDFILLPLAAEAKVPKRIARQFLEGIGRGITQKGHHQYEYAHRSARSRRPLHQPL